MGSVGKRNAPRGELLMRPQLELVRMAEEATRDKQYYEVMRPGSLAEFLALKARDSIYTDFLRLCSPQSVDTILDVGASDVITAAANFIERLYPYPERLTAVGLGQADAFKRAFPDIKYLQIGSDDPLPFSDDAFSMAVSNAVLEHVGSFERQRRFVAELCRVARKVFISVPNRYFPVEHHTGIPLLHFWDTSFRASCRVLGKEKWNNSENLILMSAGSLPHLVPPGVRGSVTLSGLRLGPCSSNLILYIEK